MAPHKSTLYTQHDVKKDTGTLFSKNKRNWQHNIKNDISNNDLFVVFDIMLRLARKIKFLHK